MLQPNKCFAVYYHKTTWKKHVSSFFSMPFEKKQKKTKKKRIPRKDRRDFNVVPNQHHIKVSVTHTPRGIY
jgi:hypothetical protein